MEFNARYALTGAFSLVAMACIFGFVYWLNNAGGFGARDTYQIRFSVPVSGMAKGGNVLFNGLKVGEITRLSFDSDKPSEFIAEVSIAKDTPIRADTKAGVDYQGLTGAANILLTGGLLDAPKLIRKDNQPPVLIADPADSRSWTQNAGRVLGRIDKMFGENSTRFDSIIAGLERMTGGGDDKTIEHKYDLKLPEFDTPIIKQGEKPDWVLAIGEPTVVLSLNTDKVQQIGANATLKSLGSAKWTDNLPNLFQSKIIQSFENAGFTKSVLRSDDVLEFQYRLIVDIRNFHYSETGSPIVMIDIMAKLIDEDGVVLGSHHIQLEQLTNSQIETDIINAFNTLFVRAMKKLVKWSVASF